MDSSGALKLTLISIGSLLFHSILIFDVPVKVTELRISLASDGNFTVCVFIIFRS